ncbi:MAG: ATP-binding cassette domain-containing protein [Candidatus Aminicenantes bacterium]|nr:ATP-binding cassette domain-containing protein [Candidatus Aminicenantes bacterium]
MNSLLKTLNLGKEYPLPKGVLRVFEGINFELLEGDLVAIMGVSGVGKTTFLNLLGALDKPSEGKILFEGDDLLSNRSKKELAELRNRKIGFIFQFYHLLPEFTALENIAFPLLISGTERKEAERKAHEILKEVSLEEKAHIRPAQLSGGEQQRVAIARALVNEPKLLLADEPTGNMDWKTGQMILALIQELHKKKGLSSIIVTHNEKVAQFCNKVYLMEGRELKLLSPS